MPVPQPISSSRPRGSLRWVAAWMLLMYLLPSFTYLTGQLVHAGLHAWEESGDQGLPENPAWLTQASYHSHGGSSHSHSDLLLDSLELAPSADQPAEMPLDYQPPLWHLPASPQPEGLAASVLVHDFLPAPPPLPSRWLSPPVPPPQFSFSA